jgi:small conductance mechanosensitive channel
MDLIQSYILPFGLKVVSALAAWVAGGWLIAMVVNRFGKMQRGRNTDPTLVKYFEGGLNVSLRILLIVAIFGILGIETTSFAALLAAAGLAIGAAWSGLLSNFAAGVFLIFLRPFKVGDYVTVNGATGTITEIGLFVTCLDTDDNVRVYVGNNAIFSDKIQNFSANPYRRVELHAQLAPNADPLGAIQRLRAKLETVPNILKTPETEIEILNFTNIGAVLTVRPCCTAENYWQVYYDTNRAIFETNREGGFSAP